MILYQVFCEVPEGEAEEWSQWMQELHIPDVLRAGYFVGYQFCREHSQATKGFVRFATLYQAESMRHYEDYRDIAAATLQADFRNRYADRVRCTRYVLQCLSAR